MNPHISAVVHKHLNHTTSLGSRSTTFFSPADNNLIILSPSNRRIMDGSRLINFWLIWFLLVLSREWGNDPQSLVIIIIIPFPQQPIQSLRLAPVRIANYPSSDANHGTRSPQWFGELVCWSPKKLLQFLVNFGCQSVKQFVHNNCPYDSCLNPNCWWTKLHPNCPEN